MTEKLYTIKHVEISLPNGLKVRADVSTIDGIRKLVEDLQGTELAPVERDTEGSGEGVGDREEKQDPIKRIEMQAGLQSGCLLSAKILAIKDDTPQILQRSLFGNLTEAILVLLFALETGLRQSRVNYDAFSSLFEGQNLKSGSPLSMLITNLRNAGYLDNKIYSDGRNLRLTAKGDTKAIEVLKRLAKA
jgi:hypothetical protein